MSGVVTRERKPGSVASEVRCFLASSRDSVIARGMKRRIAPWPLVVACLAVNPVAAQTDPGVNGIGIYFDEGATVNCLYAAPGEQVTAYLVVTGLESSANGVVGFECHVQCETSELLGAVEYSLPATGVNVEAPPSFAVGFLEPLPYASAITLLRMTFVCAGGPVLLGVGSREPCSLGYLCINVASPNDPGNPINLTPSSNVPYPGRLWTWMVAGVNAGPLCPVMDVGGSWSAVKALYGGRSSP